MTGTSRIRRALGLALCLALLCTLPSFMTACSGDILDDNADTTGQTTTDTADSDVKYTITFSGDRYTTSDASCVAVDSSALVLIKGGVYRLSGERTGQLQVSVAKTERVTLILDDLTITSATSAALYVKSADRVYLEVPAGKTATFSDASSYIFPTSTDTKPNACIYAADDLTFRGSGTLVVHGNYNNGIGCKNDIVIESGTIQVDAVKNAVKGKGSVTLRGSAALVVLAAHDGIKSDEESKESKGYVLLEGQATATITCEDDAIAAFRSITIGQDAVLHYRCGGRPLRTDGVISAPDASLQPLN